MSDPRSKVRVYLGSLGIHEADTYHFFEMLKAAHFGQDVEISSFVVGVLKLKGEAQSLDVQALIFELKLVHKRIVDIHDRLKSVEANSRRPFPTSSDLILGCDSP